MGQHDRNELFGKLRRARALICCVAAAIPGCGGEDASIPADREPAAPAYSKPLGAAVDGAAARDDTAYRERLESTFTSLTPENAMKWEVVEPARDDWRFGDADALVELARRTRRRVRGHPLVWDQQLPDWVAALPPEEVEAALREHVTKLVARYRGRVESWDVVNEPLADGGGLERNVFERALGERYIDVALRAARAADPRARLFVNEIAAERGAKADALVELARRLVARGAPLDGIGLQNHTTARDFPRRDELRALIRRFARLDLDVEITEMDVAAGPDELAAQADAYAAAAGACAAEPRCTGLTVWGVSDDRSWLGPDRRPLLFDAAGRPKPARAAVVRALRRGA